MPVRSGGIYEVVLVQSYGGGTAEFLNVFHYWEQTSYDFGAGELWTEFDQNVIPVFSLFQSTAVGYTDLRVTPIFGTDVGVQGTPVTQTAGQVIGTAMPVFVAASIRKNRSSRETRSGWTRLLGLTEENTQAGIIVATIMDELQNAADAIALTLTGTTGLVFDPVLYRPPGIYSVDGVPTQNNSHWANPIASCTALNRTTSQVSRKGF